jgi:hypothetical protein
MKDQSQFNFRQDLRQDIGVILKVMGFSTAIALWIKYVMPAFPIPVSSSIALVVILLPSAIVALILKLRIEN